MSPRTQRQSSDGEAVAPSERSEVESLTSELPSSVVTGRRLGVGEVTYIINRGLDLLFVLFEETMMGVSGDGR